jgi:hypothetical protein
LLLSVRLPFSKGAEAAKEERFAPNAFIRIERGESL